MMSEAIEKLRQIAPVEVKVVPGNMTLFQLLRL